MEALKCSECGKLYINSRYFCDCGGKDFSKVELSGRGKIASHIDIHISPPQFAEDAPYKIAVVSLEEGPPVTGRIVNDDDVEIGDEVTLEREDEIGYWFRSEKKG